MMLRISKRAFLIVAILGLLTNGRCSEKADSVIPAPTGTAKHLVSDHSKLQCSQTGTASWYGTNLKGRKTASGKKYNPDALTAASRKFPMGTELNIINLKNDQNVTVTVNDRGPYSHKRIIDMSIAAAHELGMKKTGLAHVCVQTMEQADAQADLDKK